MPPESSCVSFVSRSALYRAKSLFSVLKFRGGGGIRTDRGANAYTDVGAISCL